MNNTTKNKHKVNKPKTQHKHKTKTTNKPVWCWMQYADIMFEFSLLPVVLLLAFSNISMILLILVIPVSIFLGVLQSALIINAGNKNDKIICFISTSIIYALMLSNVKLALPVVGLFILSIIIGLIGTYIAYIITMKRKNSAHNNVDTVITTAANAGMSDNKYYTV